MPGIPALYYAIIIKCSKKVTRYTSTKTAELADPLQKISRVFQQQPYTAVDELEVKLQLVTTDEVSLNQQKTY